jgi:hypothetical protein
VLGKATNWVTRVQFLTRGVGYVSLSIIFRVALLTTEPLSQQGKAVPVWSCPLKSTYCQGYECVQIILLSHTISSTCQWHHQKLNAFTHTNTNTHTHTWHNYIHNLCALYTYFVVLLLTYMYVYIISSYITSYTALKWRGTFSFTKCSPKWLQLSMYLLQNDAVVYSIYSVTKCS